MTLCESKTCSGTTRAQLGTLICARGRAPHRRRNGRHARVGGLLGGAPKPPPALPPWVHLSFAFGHITTTTVERVCFARMAASMTDGVLLMHAMLTVLNTVLFMVLRLARSQSGRSTVSEKLMTLRPLELLGMAVLGAALLLALDGATQIMGTMQVMLLQGIVPATVIFSPLLPADPLRPQTYSRLQLARRRSPSPRRSWRCCSLAAVGACARRRGGRHGLGRLRAQRLGPWASRLIFASSALFAALGGAQAALPRARRSTRSCSTRGRRGAAARRAGARPAAPPPPPPHAHRPLAPPAAQRRSAAPRHRRRRRAAQARDDAARARLLRRQRSPRRRAALRRAGAAPSASPPPSCPATLLAFVRPVPLPYSWAAPPEPLTAYQRRRAAHDGRARRLPRGQCRAVQPPAARPRPSAGGAPPRHAAAALAAVRRRRPREGGRRGCPHLLHARRF